MLFGGPRFRDLVPAFLAHQAMYSDDRRTTASNLRIIERHIGDLQVTSIKLSHLQEFVAARLKAGIGRATVNRQRATLSRFFTWAIEQGHHPGPNPVAKLPKFRESQGRTRYLSSEEATRLHFAAAHHLKPIIMAALYTGGRLSELLSLRWKDVDLQRGVVVFRKETTKSRRERLVPLARDLRLTLASMKVTSPEDPIFGYRGQGVKSIRTAFELAREKAGLPDLHFHDLRHTYASWYVQNGGDVNRLQKYLGHSNMNLTQRYAHISEEFLRDGVQYFGPPKSRSPMRGAGDQDS
jgi:integrase